MTYDHETIHEQQLRAEALSLAIKVVDSNNIQLILNTAAAFLPFLRGDKAE